MIILNKQFRSKLIFALTLLATGGISESTLVAENDPVDAGANFDFYILTMLYQPENCYEQSHFYHKDAFGCENPIEYWKSHLTLHGLWPQNEDGTWPSYCSDEPFDAKLIHDLATELGMEWPNVDYKPSSPKYTDFWKHEWDKHGTCSGLSQHAYFEQTLKMFLNTPSIIAENYGGFVTKTELTEAYGDISVVPICSHHKYLVEIRSCLGKQKKGHRDDPMLHIDCPQTVLDEGNCDEHIHLATFNSIDPSRMMQRY